MISSALICLALTCLAATSAIAMSPRDAPNLEAALRMKKPICGEQCRFRWCKTNEFFSLAPVGRLLNLRDTMSIINPYVCLPDRSMGRVLSVRQASVQMESGTVRISNFPVIPALPTNFFTVGLIPSLTVDGLRRSGLRRMPTTAEQYAALDNLCVIMPIRRIENLDPVTKMSTGKSRILKKINDCVSFRTQAPVLNVELFWESSDDFDLQLIEPDLDQLDRLNPRTEAGRFNNDNGIGECEPPRVHHENAIYRSGAVLKEGTYTVNVKLSRNCVSTKGTRYALRVMLNGETKIFTRKFSNAVAGTTVLTTTFTIPFTS